MDDTKELTSPKGGLTNNFTNINEQHTNNEIIRTMYIVNDYMAEDVADTD